MGGEKEVYLILHVAKACAAGQGTAYRVVRPAEGCESWGWVCDSDLGGELVDP
jgi:hypothetical protein